jgi:predicted dehydrogenase
MLLGQSTGRLMTAGRRAGILRRSTSHDASPPEMSAQTSPIPRANRVSVGLVGIGLAGRVHSLAYQSLRAFYPGLPDVERTMVADSDARIAKEAIERYGWGQARSRWQEVTRSNLVTLVDVATPNHLHAEIALDAVRHGKDVLCEKPLADTVEAARAMYEAAASAEVVHRVGFAFRTWPAIALARQIVSDGRLGRLLRFRGHYFHDYALDRDLGGTWRLSAATAGTGSIGDIGSHLIDLARYLVGEIDRVFARSRTVYERRPLSAAGGLPVDVDDATELLCEFESGAVGVIESNWMAPGFKTDLSFEVAGEAGCVQFSWQRNNELRFYSYDDPTSLQGFRTIIIGPSHRGAEAFWPVAGKGLGWDDAFLIQARELVRALATGEHVGPTFLDGLRACEVVDAAVRSNEAGTWVPVSRFPA